MLVSTHTGNIPALHLTRVDVPVSTGGREGGGGCRRERLCEAGQMLAAPSVLNCCRAACNTYCALTCVCLQAAAPRPQTPFRDALSVCADRCPRRLQGGHGHWGRQGQVRRPPPRASHEGEYCWLCQGCHSRDTALPYMYAVCPALLGHAGEAARTLPAQAPGQRQQPQGCCSVSLVSALFCPLHV